MDTTARRLELLGLLHRGVEWTAAELADRLGVSKRTLRRDVSRLRDLGYTIDSTVGGRGCYRFAGGRPLPPLVLNDEETVAVAVGLRAAGAAGIAGGGDAAVGALAKLESTLPRRLRARLSAVAGETVDLSSPSASGVEPETLAAVALACRRGERCRLAYRDRDGHESRRDVDPYRVVRSDTHWYLVALDVVQRGWRTFRVDRVADWLPLSTKVELHDVPDPARFVAEALAFGPHERHFTVRLHMSLSRARQLMPFADARAEDRSGATLVELGGDEPGWTARYLVSLACEFDVVEGDELGRELGRLGSELVARSRRLG